MHLNLSALHLNIESKKKKKKDLRYYDAVFFMGPKSSYSSYILNQKLTQNTFLS